MKNGIDILLILVLLATIGLLIYFGLGEVSTVGTPTFTLTPFSLSSSTDAASNTPTSLPTSAVTPTLIPASVTIPTKTFTVTAPPTKTPTVTPTSTVTSTATPPTGIPASQIDQEIKSGIERGNRIVKAIESYHNAKSQYPSTLNDLVPKYLADIPITSTGQAFFYRLFDQSNPLAPEVYWVSFRAINQDHVACTYYRRLDYWDCDYSSP
jgi:hypothetical protein